MRSPPERWLRVHEQRPPRRSQQRPCHPPNSLSLVPELAQRRLARHSRACGRLACRPAGRATLCRRWGLDSAPGNFPRPWRNRRLPLGPAGRRTLILLRHDQRRHCHTGTSHRRHPVRRRHRTSPRPRLRWSRLTPCPSRQVCSEGIVYLLHCIRKSGPALCHSCSALQNLGLNTWCHRPHPKAGGGEHERGPAIHTASHRGHRAGRRAAAAGDGRLFQGTTRQVLRPDRGGWPWARGRGARVPGRCPNRRCFTI